MGDRRVRVLVLAASLHAACASGGAIETGASSGPSGSTDPSGAGGDGGGLAGSGGEGVTSSGSPTGNGTGTPAGSGGGDTSSTGTEASTGTGSTTTTASSGTGSACAGDAACEDGDPCTLDVCDAQLGCLRTAVAPGQVGTVEAGGCQGGVCQVDGSCGWSLYQRTLAAGAPFTRQALSTAWGGANAPPPRGILAADRMYAADVLLVVADDGNTYRRVNGAWLAPVGTSAFFSGIDALAVDAAQIFKLYVGDATEYLYLSTRTAPRTMWAYQIDAAANVTFQSSYELTPTDDPALPPQGSADCDFQLNHQYAYADQNPWIDTWYGYQGNVWVFDNATFAWIAYGPLAASPLFGGMAGGPAPATTRAAYVSGGAVVFVAP